MLFTERGKDCSALFLAWMCVVAGTLHAGTARSAVLDVGGSIAVTTDYIYRGVSQSRNEAVPQLDVHLQAGEHWVIGAWASPVEPRLGERAIELDLYTHWRQYLGRGFSSTVGATYYRIHNDPRNSAYNYLEWTAGLNWRERLMVSVGWAPENVLRLQGVGAIPYAETVNVELSARQPLPHGLSVQAGIGYFAGVDLPGSGYVYASSSVGRSFGAFEVALSYHWVQDDQQRRYIPGLPGTPWAVTVAWTF